MRFWQRLFAKTEPPRTLTERVSGPRSFELELVELSIKSLDAFWKATSDEWRHKEGDRDFYVRQTDATLVSDCENRLPHSIRVEIAGKVIGHLKHADALRLHRRLKDLGYDQIKSRCDAHVVGRTGYWEVHLDLDLALPGVRAAPTESNR